MSAIRCSCQEYRLLASGQADFLLSASLNPWDHAAGLLIVDEAGGWAKVDGHNDHAPTLHHGRMIAASCQSVGERALGLCKCLP
jgi:fructose-1,6-bisphosphatase/inositol monophosphatase family enzyme